MSGVKGHVVELQAMLGGLPVDAKITCKCLNQNDDFDITPERLKTQFTPPPDPDPSNALSNALNAMRRASNSRASKIALQNRVLKLFHRPQMMLSDFNSELDSFRELSRLMKNDLKTHTAISGIPIYGKEVVGFVVSDTQYYVVNERGHKTLEDLMRDDPPPPQFVDGFIYRLLRDILETLAILNKANFAHGDIKPDNIMLFKSASSSAEHWYEFPDGDRKRFKLIDWEYSRGLGDISQLPAITSGDRKLGSHPMYYEISMWRNIHRATNVALRPMGMSFTEKYVTQLMLPSKKQETARYLSVFRRSWDNWARLQGTDTAAPTKQSAFDKYKSTFDLHSLGMVGYAVSKRFRTNSRAEWTAFCEQLCMFGENMLLDAASAVAVIDELRRGLASGSSCVLQTGTAETAKVYTACCESSRTPGMLCEKMKAYASKQCTVYTKGNSDTSLKQTTMSVFDFVTRSLLDQDASHVAKEFSSSFFKLSTDKGNFEKEIQNLFEVSTVYNDGTNANMTALPTLALKDTTDVVYGVVVDNGTFSKNTHIVFNAKGRLDMTDAVVDSVDSMKAFMTDIADSLTVLHGRNMIHGDIKPANMMSFRAARTYRLIDWGKLKNVETFDPSFDYYGSERAGSPVSFYFSKLAKVMLKKARVDWSVGRVSSKGKPEYLTLTNSFPDFESKYKGIMDLFAGYLNGDKEDVFNNYKFNIDLFGFGMSCLFILAINGITDKAIEAASYALLTATSIRDWRDMHGSSFALQAQGGGRRTNNASTSGTQSRTSKWVSTGRKATLPDGRKRTLYSNAAHPGDTRVRRMRKVRGRTVATYIRLTGVHGGSV